MASGKIKVVIDANIWLSFLIGKVLSSLEDVIVNDRILVLLSAELIEEIVEVLHRPKFVDYFSSESINELVSLLLAKYGLIEIHDTFNICRDPKDNFLLNLCAAGNADYLVTGDADLLALNSFRNTKIIDYKSFQNIIDDMISI